METKQILAIISVALLAVLAVSSVVTAVNTAQTNDVEDSVYKERCEMLEKVNERGGNVYLDSQARFEVKAGNLSIHGHFAHLKLTNGGIVDIDIAHISYIHIN